MLLTLTPELIFVAGTDVIVSELMPSWNQSATKQGPDRLSRPAWIATSLGLINLWISVSPLPS